MSSVSISFIIPYFHGAGTVKRAIDSVLNFGRDAEVVIVADGCDTSPRSILKEAYANELVSGRIRCIDLYKNSGQGYARNVGVAGSSGRYIAFLDQDDEIIPMFFLEAKKILDMNSIIGYVEGKIEVILPDNSLLSDSDPRGKLISNSVPWNVLLRRSAFHASSGFPDASEFRTRLAGEDIALKTVLRSLYNRVSIDTACVRHYCRDGSATMNFLSRTRVLGKNVIFEEISSAEADGTLAQALSRHYRQATLNWSGLGRLYYASPYVQTGEDRCTTI